MSEFEKSNFLYGGNSIFIEELYEKYKKNPTSVDPSWISFFQEMDDFTPIKSIASIIAKDGSKLENVQSSNKISSEVVSTLGESSLKAKLMIDAYRDRAHQLVELDPLKIEKLKTHEELGLNLENFGFSEEQLNEEIDVKNEVVNLTKCTVGELSNVLEQVYASNIAVEFSHIENKEEQKWLYSQLENLNNNYPISDDYKKKILKDLVEVEGFEQYLNTKFPGAKRFSVEGGDASIICIDSLIEGSVASGVNEVVLGVSHRGRLSALAKIMKKPYHVVLSGFMGTPDFPDNSSLGGDVKYHMGFSSEREFDGNKKVHLTLTANPSHLESINTVVAGKIRALQDATNNNKLSISGILVHGDTAFCGQGVVSEGLLMSELKPYNIGGIYHLVINNQLGFTANSKDSRPGRYCTAISKIVGAPIFHVNGDNIESIIQVSQMARDYRNKFKKDVVIDIVCYRKYGHNEGDEPMYTQGAMYNIIKTKKTPGAVYANKLVEQSVIDSSYFSNLKEEFKEYLDTEFTVAENYKPSAPVLGGAWKDLKRSGNERIVTGVNIDRLKKFISLLCTIPTSFKANKKLYKLFDHRVETVNNDNPIDWATAEQLAFATLLDEGTPVRLVGQDSGRGTFSHRHSVLHSQGDDSTYIPLNNISDKQAFFDVADSNLSEYGALGFEYGYSLANPYALVMWEAQFGDFANGAQIMFDQFISPSETKWFRMSGLVCLLPNGMEGQGPEHSSARLERFLQLSAKNNIQVVYPTVPASIFHLLRRQVLRDFRKPLIVMSPKSLLRHKLAVSDLSELGEGTEFVPVIDEIDSRIKATNVKKVIFCTGKVYYDLLERRQEIEKNDVVIIRLEQLYPFPKIEIVQLLRKYNKVKDYVWVQEEPVNMGACYFIKNNMEPVFKEMNIKQNIEYITRDEDSSPAVGYMSVHKKQQELIINSALGLK